MDNVIDRELAYKILQQYEEVTIGRTLLLNLVNASHVMPHYHREEWYLREIGIVFTGNNKARVVYPEKFTIAVLRFS